MSRCQTHCMALVHGVAVAIVFPAHTTRPLGKGLRTTRFNLKMMDFRASRTAFRTVLSLMFSVDNSFFILAIDSQSLASAGMYRVTMVVPDTSGLTCARC